MLGSIAWLRLDGSYGSAQSKGVDCSASRARTGLAGRAVDNWFWRNLVRNHGSSLPCVPACVPPRQSLRAAGHYRARVHLGSPSFGLLGHLNNLIWDALDERRYSHRGVLI